MHACSCGVKVKTIFQRLINEKKYCAVSDWLVKELGI